jgi:hypothetical protein
VSIILVLCTIALLVAKLQFGYAIPWAVIIVAGVAGLFFDFIVLVIAIGLVFMVFSRALKLPKEK